MTERTHDALLTIRLPGELAAELRAVADWEFSTVSGVVRMLLERGTVVHRRARIASADAVGRSPVRPSWDRLP